MKNKCLCGGSDEPHECGSNECFRFIVEGEEVPGNRRLDTENFPTPTWIWDVMDHWVTEYTLFHQRGYSQHESGNWSRPKSRESLISLGEDW